MIELLAQVRAESSEADHLRATTLLGRLQPRRALILWITDLAETAMRPEVIDGAMQLLRRHVLLFVAMAQPEVDSIAQRAPRTWNRCFARPQPRRWPAAASCCWPACTSKERSPSTSIRSRHLVGSEPVPEGERARDGVDPPSELNVHPKGCHSEIKGPQTHFSLGW